MVRGLGPAVMAAMWSEPLRIPFMHMEDGGRKREHICLGYSCEGRTGAPYIRRNTTCVNSCMPKCENSLVQSLKICSAPETHKPSPQAAKLSTKLGPKPSPKTLKTLNPEAPNHTSITNPSNKNLYDAKPLPLL